MEQCNKDDLSFLFFFFHNTRRMIFLSATNMYIRESKAVNIRDTNPRIIRQEIQIFEHIQHPRHPFSHTALSSNSLRNRSKRILRSNIKDAPPFLRLSLFSYIHVQCTYTHVFTFPTTNNPMYNPSDSRILSWNG